MDPIRLTVAGLTADNPIPRRLKAVGYQNATAVAGDEGRPHVVVGILADLWPGAAPWGPVKRAHREDLADYGGRVLEAAYALGVAPHALINPAFELYLRTIERLSPPSREAIDAAKNSSKPTEDGTASASTSPSDTSTLASGGSS